MSSPQRRYVFLEQGVGAAVFNFLLNAAIAWAMFRGAERVPLWGQQSIAADTIGTSFVLPFLTCLIVTRMTWGRVHAGHLAPLAWTRESHPALGWLPVGTARRALVLGAVGLVLLAPPTVAAFHALEIPHLSVGDFVVFKAGFAAAEAAIVTPLVALWALAGTPRTPSVS